MKIMKTMQRFPGGMMVIPLLLAALLNTFYPHALRIGGFTEQLFVFGSSPLIALYLLCAAAGINVRKVGRPLEKGAVLFVAKVVSGIVIGLIVAHFYGVKGLLGISPLALIPAMTAINGGLFGGLAGEFGDNTDVGALAPVLLGCSPFFTLIALGASGLISVPYSALFAVIFPMIVGFVLGNLDDDWKEMLTKGQNFLVPFFAWSLGMNLNFHQLVAAGVQGIVLGLITLVVTGGLGFLGYRLFFRDTKPAIGAAIGTTAGLSVAFPAVVAQVAPGFTHLAAVAAAQISSAVIVTAILCPLVVSLLAKRSARQTAKQYQ
ncbi:MULTISPECIES: 2-keto-3-deoxygluconate permease [Serratia]|uniref:2-keto-3-deoxygluconate permease n=1 Tax=Serratia TaxID=613 RepID=UPI000C00062A|nr:MULTISPECIES: 2-keto-3-deoxygluconate permease [Serratia]MDW5499319.1 2-keto-3-deoxygluconate permease [Serratia proteamaculans]MDW5504381.1 2-keto-3-deoxygluconate permease [Pseudomonas lundensis]CAI2431088.1 2-keto-3-deoxygluconate permease [Serratia proteamaculans]HCV66297.1 2-keto-3-deoxygluconate permease [Serratia sp. (in: enterobacteria)]